MEQVGVQKGCVPIWAINLAVRLWVAAWKWMCYDEVGLFVTPFGCIIQCAHVPHMH